MLICMEKPYKFGFRGIVEIDAGEIVAPDVEDVVHLVVHELVTEQEAPVVGLR